MLFVKVFANKGEITLSLNKMSDEELKKCLLEDFNRRLDLKKYFVFNLGELTTEKIRDDYGNTGANGRVVTPRLAKDLTKLSGSHNGGEKKIIIFEDEKGMGASDEWKDKKLDEKIANKDTFFIFQKDDE